MTVLVSLPVLLPILAAGVSLMLAGRVLAQRLLTAGVLTAVLADAVLLLVAVEREGTAVVTAGGWAPPLGIALVADLLSALLLAVSVLVALAVLLFAVGQGGSDRSGAVAVPFQPAYLLLVGGVGLAFLSGDLFNLFVAFEVLLASSYVLITLNAGEARVRAGMTYTMTSLLSSLLFLTVVALVYAATGTVSLGELAVRTAELPDGVRAALMVSLLLVFGLKAAVVPLHFWLPDSYPVAPAPITAVFAALLTKVGVYAMVRTQSLMFPREDVWPLVACAAALTMLTGILGAVAQDNINRLLSFTLVSHIGFMLFGLSLSSADGLAGTILYIVHHIIVQASLFLVSGLVVAATGTSALHRMERGEGALPPPPLVAALFALPALSLAGVPPFSGFVAKFALLRAAAAQGGALAFAVSAAALATSLLTLYAMVRVWRAICARPSEAATAGRGRQGGSVPAGEPGNEPAVRPGRAGSALMTGASAGMVAVGVALAVGAGPLAEISERAASELSDPGEYRRAVLDEEAP